MQETSVFKKKQVTWAILSAFSSHSMQFLVLYLWTSFLFFQKLTCWWEKSSSLQTAVDCDSSESAATKKLGSQTGLYTYVTVLGVLVTGHYLIYTELSSEFLVIFFALKNVSGLKVYCCKHLDCFALRINSTFPQASGLLSSILVYAPFLQ